MMSDRHDCERFASTNPNPAGRMNRLRHQQKSNQRMCRRSLMFSSSFASLRCATILTRIGNRHTHD